MKIRWLKHLTVPLLVVVIGVIYSFIAYQSKHEELSVEVEGFIEAFLAQPEDETARALLDILATGRLSQQEAQPLLKALFYPDVTTHDRYAFGKPVYISYRRPLDYKSTYFFAGKSLDLSMITAGWSLNREDFQERIAIVQDWYEMGRSSADLAQKARLRIKKAHDRAGIVTYLEDFTETETLKGELLIYHRVDYYHHKSINADLDEYEEVFNEPIPSDGYYEYQVEIPVEMNMVPPGQADRVEMVSDPELDRTMREVFFRTEQLENPLPIEGKERKDEIRIEYYSLPENVAFQAVFIDKNNTTYPVQPERLDQAELPETYHQFVGWYDESGEFVIHAGAIPVNEPGLYEGEVRFESSADVAYEYPAMATIWQGSLSFPFFFKVEE